MTAELVEEETRDPIALQYIEAAAGVVGNGDLRLRGQWERLPGQLWERIGEHHA